MSESQSLCSLNDDDLDGEKNVSSFWSAIHSLDSLPSMTSYEHILYNMGNVNFSIGTKKHGKNKKGIKKKGGTKWGQKMKKYHNLVVPT